MFAAGASVPALPARAALAPVDARVSAIPAARLVREPASALVDMRKQRVAKHARSLSYILFFAWVLSQALGFFYLWSTGSAARLRDAMRRRIRSVVALRFVYGASLTYLSAFASLPASIARFRVDGAFGSGVEPVGAWIRDGFVGATIDAFVVGATVAAVFALVDRTRLWYLFAMAGLFVATLLLAFVEPVTIAPLFNRLEPLPQHARIRAPLDALARRAGIYGAPIEVADLSRRSRSIVADIAGFGPTKRVVLGDALLANATRGEILFVTAREFGHYAHGDDFRLSLFWTSLFILAIAIAVSLADRLPFRRDDDALSRLTLVFGFMALVALALVPIYNAYSRNIESRADAYALALTRDRVSAVRAYVRIADETLAPICPSTAARLYFFNSPPIGTRVARANRTPDPCR